MKHPVVVAITGASGVIYGQRLLEVLLASTDVDVHLTISDSGRLVLQHELGLQIDLHEFSLQQLLPEYERCAELSRITITKIS